MKQIFINSKKVQPGSTFIAIVGEVHDGHDFIEEAITNGAHQVFYSRTVDQLISKYSHVSFKKVEDTTAELGRLAAEHLSVIKAKGNLQVVAITGSVGKTTTKDILGQLLSHFGKTVFPKSSFNNQVGVPLTLLEVDEDTKFLVSEIGASHVGDVEYLTNLVKPDIAILLKAGVAHIGEFGGEDVIALEKPKIFASNPKFGIITADCANSPQLIQAAKTHSPETEFLEISRRNLANIQLDDFNYVSFDFESVHFKTNFSGIHQVYNIQAALLAARKLGFTSEQLAPILAELHPVADHRMKIEERPNGAIVIDDTYNANPDSMKAAIDVLVDIATRKEKRPVAVLGEMFELGSEGPALHAEVGRYANDKRVAEVLTYGPLSKHFIDDVADPTVHERFKTWENAPLEQLMPDSIYLFKASNGNRLWELIPQN